MEEIKQGYKQTDIGVIPEDWEVKTVFNIAPLQRGFDLPINNISHGLHPVVFSNGILKYHNVCRVKGPGVVTGRSGTIGKLFYVPNDFWPHNTTLWVTNFRGNSPIFVYYLFNRLNFTSLATGSGVPTLNRNDIHELKIAIPNSKTEQTAIATALSDTDALITALDKKIAKKQQIKQGAIQQLLTGKKRLPGFSGEWVEKKLEELLDYEQPTDYIVKNTDYLTQGIPVLTAGKSFILGYTTETNGIFENTPVIIFDDFTTATKFVDFKFKVKSSAMKILKLREQKNNIKLIFELMQLIIFPMIDHQRYWISEYSKIIIKIPSKIEEQTAIAQILTDMDNEIAQLEKERDKYKDLKAGMMQVLLTGKIRLI